MFHQICVSAKECVHLVPVVVYLMQMQSYYLFLLFANYRWQKLFFAFIFLCCICFHVPLQNINKEI
ncbi:hypothetical protein DYJ25_02155 [Prevotella denticola]|nr:hypothetical protein DYJ25_02155 [Prevotella denticola]